MSEEESQPGEPAPASGVFFEVNIFGTPTGQRVQLEAGEPLPAAPVGFRWVRGSRLLQAFRRDDPM